MTLYKHTHISRILVTGALLGLVGCGAGQRPTNSGNFSGAVANESESESSASHAAVASVKLSSAYARGGTSSKITVNMTRPAPGDGAVVQLKSSDASVVTIPATVTIPSGQTSATVEVSAAQVTDARTVAISAVYGDTVAGTSLNVGPPTVSEFTVAVQPSSVTIVPGRSASAKVITKVAAGYNHALQLKVSNVPTGVSVSLVPALKSASAKVITNVAAGYNHALQLKVSNVPTGVSVSLVPALIPAPGAGTSIAHITVANTVAPGIYSMLVKASNGTIIQTARLSLTVASSGAGATFQGCWHYNNGHRYQGVRISVANPGTYPFDAVLYRGATCDPANFADEFGFDTPLNFGGFGYIFWFRDFADQSDMSAFWHVGNDRSQCVSYAVAPDC